MATIKDRYILDIDTRGASANLGKLKAALIAVGGAVVTKQILDVTASFEDLRNSLNVVTGSIENGGAALDKIKDFARTSQFGVEELSRSFISLKANGIEPTNNLLRLFSDTAAVTTDQLGALEAMTKLFSRAAAGAGIQVEDLDILAERGIPVYKILEEQLGKTRGEITEFGNTAEGTRQILLSLQEGLNKKFGGASLSILDNLSTVMSNFSISMKEFINEFGQGLAPAVKAIIGDMTRFLDTSKGFARTLGESIGNALLTIRDAVVKIADSFNLIDAGGLEKTIGNLLIGMAEFTSVFEEQIKAMASAMMELVRNIGILLGIAGKVEVLGKDESINSRLQELKIFRSFLEETIEASPGRTFLEDFLDPGGVLGKLGLIDKRIKDQLADVNRMIDNLEAGRVVREIGQGSDEAAEQTKSLSDSIRELGESLVEAGEKAAETQRIREAFPFYEDAIFRMRETETALLDIGKAADETAPAAERLKSSFEEFYDNLIESSRDAVTEQTNAMKSFDGLKEELDSGRISIDVYAEAMETLNRITGRQTETIKELDEETKKANASLSDFQVFMNDIVESANDAADRIIFATQAQSELDEMLAAGRISIDAYAQAMDEINGILGVTAEKTKDVVDEQSKLEESIKRVTDASRDRIQSAEDDLQLAGLVGIQRELKEIELQEKRTAEAAKRRIREQFKDAGLGEGELAAALAQIDAATTESIRRQQEIRAEIEETQNTFKYGWDKAFEEYKRSANDNAKLTADIFNRFTRGMEDSIVEFARTGKFSMRDFLADIAEMILRSQVQRLIANIFGGMNLFGGSGRSNFAGGFANGGTIPSGQFGIVGENGPEFISGPANITPMGGSNMVTYNINAVDAPSFQQLVARDPGFIHAVSEQGRRAIPAGRR